MGPDKSTKVLNWDSCFAKVRLKIVMLRVAYGIEFRVYRSHSGCIQQACWAKAASQNYVRALQAELRSSTFKTPVLNT